MELKLTQKMSKKIFIKTFGCQMNEYDSNRIYDSVKEIGFTKTDKVEVTAASPLFILPPKNDENN